MRVLFQGDSITDCKRDKKSPQDLGQGYARFAAAMLRDAFPRLDWEFINRGINGNRSEDLKNRWQQECLDIRPDILSVLIGINDVDFSYRDNYQTTSAEDYEQNCRYLFESAKAQGAKLIVLEPFMLMSNPDREKWLHGLSAKICALRSVAHAMADEYIPLDGLFAAASVSRPPVYWAPDGIHPSDAGAWLIARHYTGAVARILRNNVML